MNLTVEHPFLSITFEKVDPKWYPLIYYMGKAISRKNKEFSKGTIDRTQFEGFIKEAEEYFKGEDDDS